MERICKPNFVLPFGSEDHSSVTRVTAVIEQPTRKLIAETGDSIASLFGLAPQGVCHAIVAHARCGALLPHRFTLTATPGGVVAVCFLLHFPSRHHAWTLSSLLPVGVRTFLCAFVQRSSDPLHASDYNRIGVRQFRAAGVEGSEILCNKLLTQKRLETLSARRH